MMKGQKLVLFFVIFCLSTVAIRGYRVLPPTLGPQFYPAEKLQYINSLQEAKRQLMDRLKASWACLMDQTCSRKVIKNIRNLAAILLVLSVYGYIGKKVIDVLRKGEGPRKSGVEPTLKNQAIIRAVDQ